MAKSKHNPTAILLVALTLSLIAYIGWFGNHNPIPTCKQLVPGMDTKAEQQQFNKWLLTLPKFTNLEFSKGKWSLDGEEVVGYARTEDSAIWNESWCV